MINYLKSENYRLLRKKSLYMTSIIGLILIIAAAIILYLSGKYEQNFPYATSQFFYANVVGSGIIILIIAFLFNVTLTGKDMTLTKQSISFGVSRNTIFWSKLFLTLSYFLLLCAIGLLLMIGLGESLLKSEEHTVRNFIIASFNMLPIVLSGFVTVHMLKMLKVSDAYSFVILLFLFVFSGSLLRMIFKPITGLNNLYKYAPESLLDENLMNYMDHAVQLGYRYWIVGIIISVISLRIGVKRFIKQNID